VRKPIYVTQPFLPPLAEFIPHLERIWESRRLTNNGPFHQELERELERYLGVPHISLFANGTLALMTALQALRVTGEVITTPYSFVATAHALLWNNIKPVFVDIHPETLNLDPERIESAITPRTTAILPVHCYGRSCNVERIAQVADTYGLKVIYDAAHAFGARDAGGGLARHGDLSVLSFHATKVFNTLEGGAIVSPDAKAKQRIDYLKNFGFANEVTVMAPGINGKMNEVQAALGLLQLKHVDRAIAARERIDRRYRDGLARVAGIRIPSPPPGRYNHAYFPILVGPGYRLSRDALYQKLADHGIHGRRYFYPLISDFSMYRDFPSSAASNLPVAKSVAEQVICLPVYPELADDALQEVIRLVAE
jgi:dTDP-4-amino-4,6-dideoxygalactose transaminase